MASLCHLSFLNARRAQVTVALITTEIHFAENYRAL